MPYRDPDRQRLAQRENTARRRQQARDAIAQLAGATPPAVAPAGTPPLPPVAPPAGAALDRPGRVADCPRMRRESDDQYLSRLRDRWRAVRRVLEG